MRSAPFGNRRVSRLANAPRTRSRPAPPVAGAVAPVAPDVRPERVRGLDVEDHTATITCHRQAFGGPEEVTQETVVVARDPVSMVRVNVNLGTTINMGDYESVKLGVSITWPCLPVQSEVDRCYAHCRDTADRFLSSMVDDYGK